MYVSSADTINFLNRYQVKWQSMFSLKQSVRAAVKNYFAMRGQFCKHHNHVAVTEASLSLNCEVHEHNVYDVACILQSYQPWYM